MNELKLETFIGRGQVRYRCPDCPWDGPSEQLAVKHWMESHRLEVSPVSTLFDSKDNLIQPESEIVTTIVIPGAE